MGPSGPAAGSSGLPDKKRKADPTALNSRSDNFNQKRAKVHIARNIPAQPAEAALKDGELDLQAFVAAHEFEIRSLEQSMATSKAVGASRAFQKVPRGLRRRTASHNPRRVPKRLRARARREMAEDKTPTVEARRRKPRTTTGRIRAETSKRLAVLAARKRRRKAEQAAKAGGEGKDGESLAVVGRTPRPKIRRNQLNEPPITKARFRKRQINKTWLPTHPWQSKRSRMTDPLKPLWRFAIPLTPNEKIYRPTHRAQGDKGALVWDMSYMSTIGLYGNPVGIERVLRRVGVVKDLCWNEKGRKWRMGSRSWTGLLSREKDGERRPLGPSTIFWNPATPSGEDSTPNPKKSQRQVFLRIHPSAFLELFNELLRLIKMENPRLYIEDLRFEIGSLDFTGPASTETLLSVLSSYPNKDKSKQQHAELFQSLVGLTNPASLPVGAMLGFTIQDPRLRYPPKKVETPDDDEHHINLLEKIATWPVEANLEPYAIFDRDARHKASLLPSQKSLSRRKTDNAPGTPLKPSSSDPPIPIMLLASRSGSETQTQGTWTLLAPWKCILPIWYSIVHCPLTSGGNPRFAGLNEVRQVAFERGLPWFPGDFPGTDAGAEWELDERQKRQRAWEKRPKSKRVEWNSLDLGAGRKGEVGDGLACDFEFIFGIAKPRRDPEETQSQSQDDSMDVDQEDSVQVAKKAEPEPILLLEQISKETFKQLVSPTPPLPLPSNAIMTVRICLLGRGVVTSCARIYRLPETPTAPVSEEAEVPATIPPDTQSSTLSLPHDLRAQWLSQVPSPTSRGKTPKKSQARDLETRKRLLAEELTSQPLPYPPPPTNQSDIGGHPLVPNAEDLIGFVTTGSFSLSEGRGMAIGSLAVDKVLAGVRTSPKEGKLCIVRNAGENVGWIARWEAI